MNGINYKCAQCGKAILSPNRLKKYCSDECALEAHRAQCRERAKRHYHANLEQERARQRAYSAANPEKVKARRNAWCKEHRERYLKYRRERYAKQKGVDLNDSRTTR